MNHPMLTQVKRTAEEVAKSKEFWERTISAVIGAILSSLAVGFIEKRRKKR